MTSRSSPTGPRSSSRRPGGDPATGHRRRDAGRAHQPLVAPLRHARSFDLGIGGAESNVAIGATRLGLPTAWIGRVGADEFGQLIRQTLRGEGVDVHAVVDADRPTAVMIKAHRSAQHVEVSYYRADSAGSALSPDDLDEALIAAAKVLHVSAITCAIGPSARAATHRAIEVARDTGVAVSVDFNYRRALWSPEQAADDAFAAGYLATRIGGGDFVACMDAGARVGAYAVTVHGDWEGLPTRAELGEEHFDPVLR